MIKNLVQSIKRRQIKRLNISKDNFVKARLRLALKYSIVTMLIVATLEILFFIVYSENLYQNFDNSIRNRAYSIASILATNEKFPANITILSDESNNNPFYGNDEVIQVIDNHGNIIFSTINRAKLGDSTLSVNKFLTTYKIENIDNKRKKILLRTYTTPIESSKGIVGYVRVGQTYANLREILSESFFSLLLILPIIMVFTWVIAYKTSKVILQPVENSYRRLKQFTEDASHELKTPLSIIRTNIDVTLEKKHPTNEELRKKMAIISRSTDRMSKTITQMLLLARIDSESMGIHYKIVNLNHLLKKIVEDFAVLSNKRNINLIFHADKELSLQTDLYLLEHAISNLVDNAIRYTPEKGSVTIKTYQKESKVIISVSDTGPGINEEDLPYIFDRFFRADKSRSRKTGGVGLGLAVVKEFINLLNGEIEVKSEVGKGTSFYIHLPRNR